MKVLIIGAAGFIGSTLALRLLERGVANVVAWYRGYFRE